MILTKDNLLRYVKEKKAVTPTMVSESFETTTMIASAALSELAKEKLINITHLKLSSSPYYYDVQQKEYLTEIGLKHYSKYEKDVLIKLKEKEILSDNSLTVQEKLAIEKIKDFAIPIEINNRNDEKTMKFWIWYLRNLEDTRNQIINALNGDNTKKEEEKKKEQKETHNKPAIKQTKIEPKVEATISQKSTPPKPQTVEITQTLDKNKDLTKFQNKPIMSIEEDDKEIFIENYLKNNYFKIESKQQNEKGILYNSTLTLGNIKINVDCFYYFKKTTEGELIKFYTSSMKPKIIFIVNCPKKLLKFAEEVDNLTIINI